MAAYFIGVDSGTQSTKALLIDESGRVLGRGQESHELIPGLGPGHMEQEPTVWAEAMEHSIRAALHEAGVPGSEVVALGVSGQQHGFVPLDADGAVIRPAKLWCDTATAPEAEAIVAAAGGLAALIARTGNGLPAGFTASKIAWLRAHEPANYARLATVLLPHDYLNFHLTGVRRMEWGDASGTGLLDVRTRTWAVDIAALIDPALPGLLPPLADPAEPIGTLLPAVAARLGLSPACLVSAGGGDNMMGAIGTGNVVPGVLTVSLGTSGTVYTYSRTPVVDDEGNIAAFCDSTGGWLPLLCTMNVTVATELVKKSFGLGTVQLNAMVEAILPGSDGLMLLPYLNGERTPNVPDGTGCWLGWREGAHTAAHFARAAMEGTALGLGHGLARLRALGVAAESVRLTGGGSKSAPWRQIIADVFGCPVVCTSEPEGAALGAALQAMWAWRRESDPAASIADITAACVAVDESTACEPDKAAHGVYTELQAIHDQLSVALRPVFPAHRALAARLADQ
jgi:D-xylulose kinase